MDAEDELAREVRNDYSTKEPEIAPEDAPEIQVRAETSVTTSPGSTHEEVSLPPLIQSDVEYRAPKIFPSEIPDSDAVSDFSSPLKTYPAVQRNAETHNSATAMLLAAPEIVAPQDLPQAEDQDTGNGTTEEAGIEATELRGVDVTSRTTTLPPPIDLDIVEPAATTPILEAIDRPPVFDVLFSQTEFPVEDEEKEEVAAEAGKNEGIEPCGIDDMSDAAAALPPVEVEEKVLTTVIGQDEASIIEPGQSTSDDVFHEEPLLTAPEETQVVEVPPSDIESEGDNEANAAPEPSPNPSAKQDKHGDAALEAIVPDQSQVSIDENVAATGNEVDQDPKLSTTLNNREDAVMGDDVAPPSKPADNLESTDVAKGLAEQEKGMEMKNDAQLPHVDTKIEPHSIAGSDNEELPDVPVPETIPEPEPEVSRKGRRNSKTTERPMEKVAKKRGRPKKVVVPEVQREEQIEDPNEDLETIHGPSESMNLEEERSVSQKVAESALSGLPPSEPDAMDYSHEDESPSAPSVPPAATSKETSTPVPSSPLTSAIQTPVKVRLSPNPSFRMPTPVKKSQAQSSSTMILSSPSRESSSAALTISEEVDKVVATAQKGTKDVVMAELKAMKMASIQARISALQAEIAAKQEKRDELQKGLKIPAAETVKRHIKLLHDYNDIRDIGQGLVGMIADQRGLRIGELFEEFGVDVKD